MLVVTVARRVTRQTEVVVALVAMVGRAVDDAPHPYTESTVQCSVWLTLTAARALLSSPQRSVTYPTAIRVLKTTRTPGGAVSTLVGAPATALLYVLGIVAAQLSTPPSRQMAWMECRARIRSRLSMGVAVADVCAAVEGIAKVAGTGWRGMAE